MRNQSFSVRILFLSLVLGLSLSQSVSGSPPSLVGFWYGEGQPEDPSVYWLAHLDSDGQFSAVFRFCARRPGFDLKESGIWSYSGRVATLVTRDLNGHVVRQTERYDTLTYDGRKHVYRHERTGFVFTAIRVGADFEVPPCTAVS